MKLAMNQTLRAQLQGNGLMTKPITQLTHCHTCSYPGKSKSFTIIQLSAMQEQKCRSPRNQAGQQLVHAGNCIIPVVQQAADFNGQVARRFQRRKVCIWKHEVRYQGSISR